MAEEGAGRGHGDARAMLDAFASVGATHFDVTWTTRGGERAGFRRSMRLDGLASAMPAILDIAASKQRNVIVRPHGLGVSFIQLDDLAPVMLARLAPAVFLILQTSPTNFQAWVAMASGAGDKDFARRLRKGTEADATASGATRVAGSLNFKDKYAPDFPRVALEQVNAGRQATAAELERLGLVAAPETPAPRFAPNAARASIGNRKWPSYALCVKGAPLNGDKTAPDISRADFTFCMTAIDWGWSVDETAARLMEESSKAHQNGEGYAIRTVRNAAAAVERGRDSPRQRLLTPEQG